MKGIHFVLLLALILSLFFSTQAFSQNFRMAVVNYMYVPEGMNDDYLKMEKEIAKPVHEEMIKQGHYDEPI